MIASTRLGTMLVACLGLAAAVLLAACDDTIERGGDGAAGATPQPTTADVPAAAVEISPRMLRRFQPVAPSPADAPPRARVDLGEKLFEDPRLSVDGSIACASCHRLDHYGVDGLAVSVGVGGARGRRNAPSIYNVGKQFRLMWDGSAADLEAQATMPIVHASEMGRATPASVLRFLESDPEYNAAFREAFAGSDDAVTIAHVRTALADFERTLVTRGRWDRYLEGNLDALSAAEKEGLRTFLNAGCMVCHTGQNLGGLTFERVGLLVPWPNQADQGRAEVTLDPGDRMLFKVPSLRNVAETAPYFHDGSVALLEDAIVLMGRHQLGVELTQDETASIATWLRSLTGSPVDRRRGAGSTPPPDHSKVRRDGSRLAAPCESEPCPMRAFMLGNARPALATGDFDALRGTFVAIGRFAPAGFVGWSAFAREGEQASVAHDSDAARAACEGCHASMRERYRKELRSHPLER